MLAALDALIQNGTGGRRTLVLRQICTLFMTIGEAGENSTTALFDEIMANLAVDLDDDVVTFLAPELQHFSGILPAFKSTIASRSFEIQARFADPSVRSEPTDSEPVTALMEQAAEVLSPSVEVDTSQNLSENQDLAESIDWQQMEAGAEPIEPASVDPVVTPVTVPFVTLDDILEAATLPKPPATANRETKPLQEIAVSPLVERRTAPRDPVQDASNPVTLARRASPAELMEIASVAHLPEQLTSVIIMRGDRNAIVRALHNQTAKFSRSGLTTLAELAPSDLSIKQALVQRADLPELIIERMLPYLNMESRTRVLMSGAMFGEKEAKAALAQAHGDLINEYRQGQMLPGLDTYLAAIDSGNMSNCDVIIALAGDMRIAELAMFAARRLGLSHSTAMNMVASRLDKTAGILAIALQCERAAITAIMDMRRRCGVCSDARGAIETHMRMGHQEALLLVRQADQMASELEPDTNDYRQELSAAA
jgi:Uncharacterised protein conserved in bacteria (DUF2336)